MENVLLITLLLLCSCKDEKAELQKRIAYYELTEKQNYRIAKDYVAKATSMDTTVDGWKDQMSDFVDSADKYSKLATSSFNQMTGANDTLKYLNSR